MPSTGCCRHDSHSNDLQTMDKQQGLQPILSLQFSFVQYFASWCSWKNTNDNNNHQTSALSISTNCYRSLWNLPNFNHYITTSSIRQLDGGLFSACAPVFHVLTPGICPNGTWSCAGCLLCHPTFFIITRKCGMRATRINYMATTGRASRSGGVGLQDGARILEIHYSV